MGYKILLLHMESDEVWIGNPSKLVGLTSFVRIGSILITLVPMVPGSHLGIIDIISLMYQLANISLFILF